MINYIYTSRIGQRMSSRIIFLLSNDQGSKLSKGSNERFCFKKNIMYVYSKNHTDRASINIYIDGDSTERQRKGTRTTCIFCQQTTSSCMLDWYSIQKALLGVPPLTDGNVLVPTKWPVDERSKYLQRMKYCIFIQFDPNQCDSISLNVGN